MSFAKEIVQQVWEKGRGTQDQEASMWRKDECGAWMKHDHYENAHSEYGWRIENVSVGLADVVDNLRPFQRQNAFDRANGRAKCHVTADRTELEPTEHIDQPRNRAV